MDNPIKDNGSDRKLKNLLVILIITLVIGVVANIFILQYKKTSQVLKSSGSKQQVEIPTKSDVVEKKMNYIENKHRFSFDYPENWSITTTSDILTYVNKSNKQYLIENRTVSPIAITIYKDTFNSDINNFMANSSNINIDKSLYKGKSTISSKETMYTIKGQTKFIFIDLRVIFKSGFAFVLANNYENLKNAGNQDIDEINTAFNKITSSFHFF